jgi:DNA invertase Pin-like site-specific DNA recombinase
MRLFMQRRTPVLSGYMRVSKADGIQALDLQRDALLAAGVNPNRLYEDHTSGKRDSRPGLDACLNNLRRGDTLVAWKLDRIGRDLPHLINLVHELTKGGVELRVLAGAGASIGTVAPNGWLISGVFAALAEFEHALLVERAKIGLVVARARDRRGGRPYKMTAAKLRRAQAAMAQRETKPGELCAELGISRQTLYRHMDARGRLRPDGEKLLRRIAKPEESESPTGTCAPKTGERHA